MLWFGERDWVADKLGLAGRQATKARVRREPIAVLRAENDERLDKVLTDAQRTQEHQDRSHWIGCSLRPRLEFFCVDVGAHDPAGAEDVRPLLARATVDDELDGGQL